MLRLVWFYSHIEYKQSNDVLSGKHGKFNLQTTIYLQTANNRNFG